MRHCVLISNTSCTGKPASSIISATVSQHAQRVGAVNCPYGSAGCPFPFMDTVLFFPAWPLNLNITFIHVLVISSTVVRRWVSQAAKNQQRQTNKQHMKKKLPLIIGGAMMCLALAPAAFAQTTDGSVLYTPSVNLSSLSQNSFVGTVGGIFLTSYSYYPEVNYLGYADPTGAPLVNSHLVTLWDNSTQSIIASATVPAGTAAPLVDGYRWVQLSSTVTLNYGSYYVIGAQTDGVDLWGDLISNNSPDNGNNGQITWNPEYVQLGSGWEFTRAGRYDSAGDYPNEPPNQTSVQDSIYPAANLGFDVVPEPASLSIAGVGATLLFGLMLKRKS